MPIGLAHEGGFNERGHRCMRLNDEIIDLRAERMALLAQLDSCSNSKRQILNKRIMRVSKRIQRLCGISDSASSKDEI